MVRQPAVFLMDEPLSNLDAKLRVQMRAEIKELHQRLGITFIYVTHDQSEAMTMSDRVAVMLDGELDPGRAAADDLCRSGRSPRRRVHRLTEDQHARRRGPRRPLVDAAGSTLALETRLSPGTPIILGIRPEAFYLVEGRINGSGRAGPPRRAHGLRSLRPSRRAGRRSSADCAPAGRRRAPLRAGQTVHLGVDADRALLFDANGVRTETSPRQGCAAQGGAAVTEHDARTRAEAGCGRRPGAQACASPKRWPPPRSRDRPSRCCWCCSCCRRSPSSSSP